MDYGKDVTTERIGNALGLISLIAFPLLLAAAAYMSSRERIFYLSSNEKEENSDGNA